MKKTVVCLVSPLPPPLGGMAIQAGKLRRCLEEEGVTVIPVRTNVTWPKSIEWIGKIPFVRTIANSLLFLTHLGKALRHCDVVYFLSGFFNFFFWITLPAIILIKIRGKKIILNARGGGAQAFFKRWKWIVKPVIQRCEMVTTPSGFLQDIFKEQLGMMPVVIPNIADFKQFRFKKRTVLEPRLIITRSLEDIYNVACAIQAFKILHDQYPQGRLSVVGDGTLRAGLEKLTRDLGLTDAVTFHGRVSHDQIQDLYEKNDIFINSSNVDNLPGTILEAFACGLPVVSTNAGGIPYMVDHGRTGLLVEKNDHAALARQTALLLEDRELADRLTHNAWTECQNYAWDSIKKRLLPVLYGYTQ
jgi:glycosyltransferase involved in cell wall biosynthesis